MSYGSSQPGNVAPPPRRRGPGASNWSPGAFSPAIFIVALLVIALLVALAVLSQQGGRDTPATTAVTATATGVPVAVTGPARGTGRIVLVGNTGGEGVYLRRTPRLDDRDTAYPDGTRLEQIDADVTANGITWRRVRAPDGKTGWVPAQYTIEGR